MAFVVYVGLTIIYLSRSFDAAHADWGNPPFMKPDLNDEALRTFEFASDIKRLNIALDEEVDHEICIATLNYTDNPSPSIGRFTSGKSNEILGAELRQNSATKFWSLWIKNRQDYETPAMRAYGFSIFLGSTVYSIALLIKNINDNPPTVQALQKNCRIEENYKGPSNCTYSIKDADGSVNETTFLLSFVPPDGKDHFKFVTYPGKNSEYELIAFMDVTKPLDFEAVKMYMISIQATDGAKNTGSFDTVIEVTDTADTPPTWTEITATINIIEKSTNSFRVSAIDGDIQIDATINYMIVLVDKRDAGYFVVDKNTGTVTINKIDRDQRNQEIYRFVIIAYEKPQPESRINATIVVIVEDINDHSPEIKPNVPILEIEIDEGKFTTLEFAPSIEINDPDLAENAQFTVSLTDESNYNWSSAFVVVPTSGYQTGVFTISVLNSSVLDYEDENWRIIDMQLRAVEVKNNNHVGTKDIRIKLKDLNDEVPIFDENTPTNVSIYEDAKQHFPIATVHATDRDFGDYVTHALVAQETLMIDEKTGEIFTKEADALDYETMRVVVVQIIATDQAHHKTYATLTINVLDVNDVPPNLYLPQESPEVEEEVLTDVKVLITATDVDTDGDIKFSIDWDNTKAQKKSVTINESFYREYLNIQTDYPDKERNNGYAEGKLVVSKKIDYEACDVIFLTISVTDRNTKYNRNRTSASMALYIIDKNDNAPIFNPIDAMDVTENQIKDALIGTVTATDADGPEFSKISYAIEPINGTKNDLVVINNLTGVIRVGLSKAIDAEYNEYLYYNVTATDGENNSTITIKIYVNDQNDVVPRLLNDDDEFIFHVTEKSSSGKPIFTVQAIDGDRTSPFNNVSYLMNANYSSSTQYFSIGRFDGLIQVNLAEGYILDRDYGQSEFTLNLKIRDNYLIDGVTSNSNAIDMTVTVILDDINDQDPILPDYGEVAATVMENTNKGERILSVKAQDDDDPNTNNTKVFYVLKNVSSADEKDIVNDGKCTSLFYIKSRNDKEADIFADCDLKGHYGRWNLELYAQDLGTNPGPRNYTRNYVIQVKDYNYNKPEIEFPTGGKKLALNKNPALGTRLKTYDNQLLRDFKATDKDYGDSGIVKFSLTSSTGDHENFEILPIETNVARLLLARRIDIESKNSYTLTLVARDGGNPSLYESKNLTIIFITKSGPKFNNAETTVWFKENQTGLAMWTKIPEAHDMVSEAEENVVNLYYFLMPNEVDAGYFALEKETRNLTVKKKLDREKQEVMTFHVIATTDPEEPPGNPSEDSILKITVVVVDENDNAPIFESDHYSTGITMNDPPDKTILTIKALDVDLNDTMTYSIISNSTRAFHSSLAAITNPFYLKPDSGDLLLKFTVTSNMEGYFHFDVIVRDKVNHEDKSTVQIYIVPQSSRIDFTFSNLASDVREERLFVRDAFTAAFGYLCNIGDVKSTVDENNVVIDNSTTVTTYFVNSEDNLPIAADVIILMSSDYRTFVNLQRSLQERSMILNGTPTAGSIVTTDLSEIIHWILITLTTLFFLCSVTLMVAYIFRTRSLKQRLDKLAVAKFGSQESGLDRAGVVPTTNQFALAGSNPVWKTSIERSIDDNLSQGSGDSDLIGIEDNPDFGYVNGAAKSAAENRQNSDRGFVNPTYAIGKNISGNTLYPDISSA